MKPALVAYLVWSLILVGIGIYVVRQMHDTSNPNSLSSSFKEFKKAVDDEDSSVP